MFRNSMGRNLFIIIFIFLNITWAATDVQHNRPDLGDASFKATDILKGTIIHIFEDIKGDKSSPRQLAKTKIHGLSGEEEFSLIQIDDDSLKTGDQIIIAKMESVNTFGMAEAFEYKYAFVDFARDHFMLLLLLPLLLLVFAINKKTMFYVLAFTVNIILLLVLLPAIIKIKFGLFVFIILFIGINSLILKPIFGSLNYDLALATTIPAVLITAIIYALFTKLIHVNEYQIITKNILLQTIPALTKVDLLTIIIPGFFLYLFSSLFFIRITYKKNLYQNFSFAIWKIVLLYSFVLIGLNIPTLTFFSLNGFGTLQLFNYLPFVQNFTKIMFLFWGNILCCTLYLLIFYMQNKEHFQKHLKIETNPNPQKPLDLVEIISDKKEAKYNEAFPAPKQKEVTKKTTRPKTKKTETVRKAVKKTAKKKTSSKRKKR